VITASSLPTASWIPPTWINRGAEQIANDPALAARLIGQGLRQLPQDGVGWFNLGLALHMNRRIAAAIRAYRLALASRNPPVADATNNLAQDLLLSGALDEGWRLYEHRFHRPDATSFAHYRAGYGEAWQGFNDPRPCDELIVVSEQGLGDTLQFCRLLKPLQERGLRTTLFCPEALAPLLREGAELGSIALMLGRSDPGLRWCPLLSLPQRLGLTASTIPAAGGYLKPDPQRVAQWRERLGRRPGHRLIALHWQGNPNFERKLYSKGRSMPFDAWLGLSGLEQVEFLSIQKGPANQQRRNNAGLRFVAGQGAFDATMDFRDTAAALACCDLLLSADSSVVHLAGALGLPTWVALSWVPEWRWGLEGSTTPWYESARLFRQPRAGDWATVVAAMAAELARP
jgi:tetratricopeptide (TPR) repeat protein